MSDMIVGFCPIDCPVGGYIYWVDGLDPNAPSTELDWLDSIGKWHFARFDKLDVAINGSPTIRLVLWVKMEQQQVDYQTEVDTLEKL